MKKEFLNKGLFTTYQVAQACSVSRSTILRLEDEGLAYPSIRDDSTGSRLYTPQDISGIMQLLLLQSLGFTHEDLKHFFITSHNYSMNIKALEDKVNLMTSLLNKLKDRGDPSRHNVVLERDMPAQAFYAKTTTCVADAPLFSSYIRDTYTDALSKGFVIDWRMSTCLIIFGHNIRDILESRTPVHIMAGVPIPSGVQEDNVINAPAHHALCILVTQTVANLRNALILLEEEAIKRHYDVAGPFCIYSIEDYYPSDPSEYTNRIAQVSLPVKPQK